MGRHTIDISVDCHMKFYIIMEDFNRRGCLVAGGHITHTWDVIIYSSVVTRETVHFIITMTALHDLEFKATDIVNTYMMTSNREQL